MTRRVLQIALPALVFAVGVYASWWLATHRKGVAPRLVERGGRPIHALERGPGESVRSGAEGVGGGVLLLLIESRSCVLRWRGGGGIRLLPLAVGESKGEG